jgi:hypothetical protein
LHTLRTLSFVPGVSQFYTNSSHKGEQICAAFARTVVEATAGLYGDLQGIAGRTLLEIEGLEVPMLDGSAGIEAAE